MAGLTPVLAHRALQKVLAGRAQLGSTPPPSKEGGHKNARIKRF